MLFFLLLLCSVDASILEYYETVIPGDATYYDFSGKGNCQLNTPRPPNAKGLRTIAMNKAQYNGSVTCGMCIQVTGHGVGGGPDPIVGTYIFYVNNQCPACKYGDMDIARKNKEGGRFDVEWTAVDCSEAGNLMYKFNGGNNHFIKFQVRNSPKPIQSMSVKEDGVIYNFPRTDDNHFKSQGSGIPTPLKYPMHIIITDVAGNVVEDVVDKFRPDAGQFEGNVQFPYNGFTPPSTTEAPATSATTSAPSTTVTTTPAEVYDGCVALNKQCGGKNYKGATECCNADKSVSCTYKNDYRSTCQVGYDSSSTCSQLNEQCGGKNWKGAECCQLGTCVYQNTNRATCTFKT